MANSAPEELLVTDIFRAIMLDEGLLSVQAARQVRELIQAGELHRGEDRVVAPSTGDAGSNTGNWHEGLNMASIWDLPVLFVLENNHYGVSTNIEDVIKVKDLSQRSVGYGIPGVRVDGFDFLAVYMAALQAVERARRGEGPTLLVTESYQFEGHYAGEPEVYRSRAEVEEYCKRDPIPRFHGSLISQGKAEPVELERIDEEIRDEIQEAVTFARQSRSPIQPQPWIISTPIKAAEEIMVAPTKRDSVSVGASAPVMSPDLIRQVAEGVPAKELSYQEAIREALREEILRDPSVFLMGEDIGKHGGAFGVTRTLFDQFGAERVINTPISENTIVGATTGAALVGMCPVIYIMFVDFSGLAMDQICTQAAKLRFMTGGQCTVPWVLRMPQGGGAGKSTAALHSQSLEAWFMHIPGIKIAMPSNAYDAKGLLKTAVRDPNPVIVFENKMLYNVKGEVPEEPYFEPFGAANVVKEGSDMTVVAVSDMVDYSLKAAETLEAEGISVEVIDPRTIAPLDIDTIVKSVRKTGKLVVAHEANLTGGIGAEIAAQVGYRAFDYLQAPIERVAAKDSPIPFAPILEKEILPDDQDVLDAVHRVMDYAG